MEGGAREELDELQPDTIQTQPTRREELDSSCCSEDCGPDCCSLECAETVCDCLSLCVVCCECIFESGSCCAE